MKTTATMKIAIPIENGRLHGDFSRCHQFALVEMDADKKLTLRTSIVSAPEHPPGRFPRWLRDEGVQVVISGGIGPRALTIFGHCGIEVRTGTAGAPVEQVAAAYLNGELAMTPTGGEPRLPRLSTMTRVGEGPACLRAARWPVRVMDGGLAVWPFEKLNGQH
jgi:predicted Fe-Mo cluster-binding NifX family protein